MTTSRCLILCILLLAQLPQAGADYLFDGSPLVPVKHGIISGGIYVDGGHGCADEMPYTQSFNVPGDVVYARLYVGIWGGNPDYTGTVETTVNGQTLGTMNLAGKADTNPNVMCTGYGVYLVTYNVSQSFLAAGTNTVTATTAGDIDGRVYGITLAAVYEGETDNAPEVEYWINDGHENLNYKTPHDGCTTPFAAATSANSDASLTVGYLCGDPGEADYLHINDNRIGGDDVADSTGDSAYGFDLKTFDVSSYFNAAGNIILFERGDETAVHPFVAVLALQNDTTPTPPPPGEKPDLVIAKIKARARVFAEKDNKIEVVVRNHGDYDVGAAFTVELTADGIPLGSVRIPDLGAGENETVEFIWNPDETIRYTLKVKADANSVIDESDETNNEGILAVDVVERMGYYGDDSIEMFEHGTINGSVVYTIGNSSYSGEMSPDDGHAVECNLTLSANATVRNARLYVYWTWSKKGTTGRDADVEVTFDGRTIPADDRYTDRKGNDPYDYPSGTYCYNVTDYIRDGDGSMINYTVVVTNAGTGYAKFAISGVNLLAVYEDMKEPEIEYWINEGCDIIYSYNEDEITPEDATTRITFQGVIDLAEVRRATLTTFVTGGNEGGNELGFNSEVWDKVYNGDPYDDLAIDERDVTDHLNVSCNYATISEIDDHGMVPSTVVLVLERGQRVPKLDDVPIAVGEITDMGIHYISEDTFGSVYGTLRFAIRDRFGRIVGYREAADVVICAVLEDCDPDYDFWLNVTATGDPTRTLRIFTGPFTNETQDYVTEICFCDKDCDGTNDYNETAVYRTTTSYDGTFALRLDKGMYSVYARY
jgi:hypothetical protein